MNSVENPELSYACDQQALIDRLERDRAALIEALEKSAEQIKTCDYTPARSTLLCALAQAKGE